MEVFQDAYRKLNNLSDRQQPSYAMPNYAYAQPSFEIEKEFNVLPWLFWGAIALFVLLGLAVEPSTQTTIDSGNIRQPNQGILPQDFVIANPDAGYNLRVRAEPTTDSEELSLVPYGVKLSVTGQESNGWIEVIVGDRTGWVFQQYVR